MVAVHCRAGQDVGGIAQRVQSGVRQLRHLDGGTGVKRAGSDYKWTSERERERENGWMDGWMNE